MRAVRRCGSRGRSVGWEVGSRGGSSKKGSRVPVSVRDYTELRFRLSRHYLVCHVRHARGPRRAPCGPTRAATASAIVKAARAVFARVRPRRADGRRRAAGQGRRRDRLPPLPHQGGAARGARRDSFAQLAAWAREASDEPDAWEAFEALLWRGAELHASDRALAEAIADSEASIADQAAEESGLAASMAELIRRAQQQGRLRPDVRSQDMSTVMCGLGGIMHRDPTPARLAALPVAHPRRPARRAGARPAAGADPAGGHAPGCLVSSGR